MEQHNPSSWRATARLARSAEASAPPRGRSRDTALGVLASGVAQQINNPLAGIMAGVARLRQGRVPADKQQAYFDSIDAALVHIERTVRDLMEYAGVLPPMPEKTDCADLVAAAAGLLAAAFEAAQVRLVSLVEGGDACLYIDRGQILQALANVLLNALQASEAGSRVELRLEAGRDGTFGIVVRDQGCGIPDAILPRVCEPFFTTKSEGEGVGLGLAVADGLLRVNGGRLDIQHTPGGGRGTQVKLWLPGL